MPLAFCKIFEDIMAITLTPAHFLAHLLDPCYRDNNYLTNEEVSIAMEFLSEHQPSALSSVLKYRAKATPFHGYMFSLAALMTEPLTWKAQGSALEPSMLSLAEQLHTARSSSAGIERIFSTFDLVHSKLRNRLGTSKAGKLVFLYKLLNMK